MKAFILAAGLGTRLRPWTLHHPKALVPVGGVPMLQRVLDRLNEDGFLDITRNVHHFGQQILDYLKDNNLNNCVRVSDESSELLDTGGAIAKAAPLLLKSEDPVLIHNVDILSDAPLRDIMIQHISSGRDISLVTSQRDSTRQLVFDNNGSLQGWHNISTGEYKPSAFVMDPHWHYSAFSGIYVLSAKAVRDIADYGKKYQKNKFPIMDYFLENPFKKNIGEIRLDKLKLIDIGKPDTLEKADTIFCK